VQCYETLGLGAKVTMVVKGGLQCAEGSQREEKPSNNKPQKEYSLFPFLSAWQTPFKKAIPGSYRRALYV
jgi:hypothetical protein